MTEPEKRDVVSEARELLAAPDRGWRPGYALELLRLLADECERLRADLQQAREDREDALDAAAEARWQERQGEDYGSY